MNQTALKHWAYKQGQAGLPLCQRAAIDIGSTVHGMAELDLKGRPDREIEAYCHECLAAPDHLRKAWSAFAQFRAWLQQCQVQAIAQERTLVSERWQYGGTPDTIAMINGGLGLLDFKTSPKPYVDHLVALAAHGALWEENNPQHPLTAGYHLPAEGWVRFCPPRLCGPYPAMGAVPAVACSLPAREGLHARQGREGHESGRGGTKDAAGGQGFDKSAAATCGAQVHGRRGRKLPGGGRVLRQGLRSAEGFDKLACHRPAECRSPDVDRAQGGNHDGNPARLWTRIMLIEIAETHPAQVGRKSATVVAKGGQRFDVWPEQLANFQVGARYDVDVSQRTFKGRTYQSITKATRVNGAARPTNGGAAAADGESQFVGRALAALIMIGAIKNDKRQLLNATDMLRALWGVTFGGKPRNGGSQWP